MNPSNSNPLSLFSLPVTPSVPSVSPDLDKLIADSRDLDASKTDFHSEWTPWWDGAGKTHLRWIGQNGLIQQVKGPYVMERNAIEQICGRLGSGTFGAKSGKSLPRDAFEAWLADPEYAPMAADLLNRNRERVSPDLLVRTSGNGGAEPSVRAILSERYAIVSSTWMLEETAKALGLLSRKSRGPIEPRVFNSHVSRDTLDLRIVVNNHQLTPSDWNQEPFAYGFYVGNNEIGRGGLQVLPMLMWTRCTNSIVFKSKELADAGEVLKTIHRGNADALLDRAAVAIGNCLLMSANMINDLLATREVEVPDLFEEIGKLAKEHNWSEQIATDIFKETKGNSDLFWLVQGITQVAQAQDPEMQTDMEMIAGDLVMAPPQRWLKQALKRDVIDQ